MYKVIVADNQSVFRTGISRILSVEDDFRVVAQVDDFARLIKASTTYCDAIVVCAGSLHPVSSQLVQELGRTAGRSVVILENDESAKDCLQRGARGIILRDISNLELVRCMRAVGRGEAYLQRRDGDDVRQEAILVADRVRDRLTEKERKIIRLLLQGYKNRDIAEELHNSEQVIKNYLRSIFDKTGVSDRLELALFALHHKLFADAPAAVPAAFINASPIRHPRPISP